ncbi:MAG: FGGY family carbohydrate kinase [Elusimicrobiota bacterium]|nr:FGGY family carbohydrate kinase [Elusimicrobiota bacterium]
MSAKPRELVLALDQGSSSSRAVLFGLDGKVVASAQKTIRTVRPEAAWAQHDPEELVRSLEWALDRVLAEVPAKAVVLCAGLAVQRSTVVFLDRRTMKPVSSAPSWMDGRAAALVAPLQTRQAEVHAKTGLYLTPYYSAPKIRWYLDHDPAVKAAADAGTLLAVPVSAFVASRLAGAAPGADPSCAQRMLLMDLDASAWDPALLSLFGLDASLLPAIRPTAGEWGVITRKGRRIPLRACVGDQQSAAIGLGVDHPGGTVANYGTGAFLLRHTGADAVRVPGLLTSAGPSTAWSKAYFLEGTVHAAGTSFEWLRDNFAFMKDAARLDEAFAASKKRVLCLPAIGGLGAPRWDYLTRTTWFGLDGKTVKADLVRGTAEGLCHLVADIAGAMTAAGFPVTRARVAGGLSKSDAMMAFQADALGATLERRREVEATALGAAVLALLASGGDASGMTKSPVEKVFLPKLPEPDRAKLRAGWTQFVDAAQRLSRAVSL